MKPEILAPAGKTESLKAAVKAGCDAVYLAGDSFGARAFAGNFNKEELLEAIDYCHLFNVKVYLTVNTLFKDFELEMLNDYIRPFYKEGLDAVLVQDMGVFKKLKEEFPTLPLHASTQTSITTPEGARLFKNLGFERIVPARELSLEEIKVIKKNVDIEIETFVHGAMCFSYSGRCLFSSFLGGRSGNRGRCAQPCRKIYEISGSKEYIMSLKDMCALESVPELIEAGIDSFKIEGRMKNPAYVFSAVSAYKKARDLYYEIGKTACDFSPYEKEKYENEILKLKKELSDIYNRGGFSKGYYFEHNGKDMLSLRRPNHEGVLVGKVKKVSKPLIFIEAKEKINKQDVLEIRPLKKGISKTEDLVEITSNAECDKEDIISLKGKEFKKINPGADVFRTRNNELIDKIEEAIKSDKNISANALVRAKIGVPLSIKIYDDEDEIEVFSDICEAAAKSPVTEKEIEEKVIKTKGSLVELKVNVEADENVFVPLSKINNLKREAIEKFKKAKAEKYFRNN